MSNKSHSYLSYEYIRGLTEGEGCFSFSTRPRTEPDGRLSRYRVPSFTIGMHERDEDLLNKVRDRLGLKNRIYNYETSQKDGIKRGRKVVLVVREFGQLKNIIIPLFYNRLHGHKGKQFLEWLEEIGNHPAIPRTYKLLYRLHKSGFYTKNPKFIN